MAALCGGLSAALVEMVSNLTIGNKKYTGVEGKMIIVKEKAAALNLDSFVQEVVLGKIASDVYNEAKKVAPLRHVGINKSKLLAQPEAPIQVPEEVIIEQ